ncbi:hypothetical protein HDE_05882 [Halotydeus destructor]|nr:hypothetical protein HDE_05882 [Halotydeus destructor]
MLSIPLLPACFPPHYYWREGTPVVTFVPTMCDASYPAPSPYKPLARARTPPPDGEYWVALTAEQNATVWYALVDGYGDRAFQLPARLAHLARVALHRASATSNPAPFSLNAPRDPAKTSWGRGHPALLLPRIPSRDRQLELARWTLEMSDEDE